MICSGAGAGFTAAVGGAAAIAATETATISVEMCRDISVTSCAGMVTHQSALLGNPNYRIRRQAHGRPSPKKLARAPESRLSCPTHFAHNRVLFEEVTRDTSVFTSHRRHGAAPGCRPRAGRGANR